MATTGAVGGVDDGWTGTIGICVGLTVTGAVVGVLTGDVGVDTGVVDPDTTGVTDGAGVHMVFTELIVYPLGHEYETVAGTENVEEVLPKPTVLLHVVPERLYADGHAYITFGARVPVAIWVVAHTDALGALTLSGLTEAETE